MKVLEQLLFEKGKKYQNGLYHLTQILFAYNSNHIEGSRLSQEQTRYIYETNTVLAEQNGMIPVDDIMETKNHFALFDFMLLSAQEPLSESLIKKFHKILKSGTTDAATSWFRVGEYKAIANVIGTTETAAPKDVPQKMQQLLTAYHTSKPTFEDIVDFHYQFEQIHPFQDGNGRVGRMIMFKECLANEITPFIVLDEEKMYYYQGLKKYKSERGYLIETCRHFQDVYQNLIKKYSFPHN